MQYIFGYGFPKLRRGVLAASGAVEFRHSVEEEYLANERQEHKLGL